MVVACCSLGRVMPSPHGKTLSFRKFGHKPTEHGNWGRHCRRADLALCAVLGREHGTYPSVFIFVSSKGKFFG